MKLKKLIAAVIGIFTSITVLTGCAAQLWEEKINVVFKLEDQIVDSGVVTQFDNIQAPTIDDAYVPNNYRFLGWTYYETNQLSNDAATFKTQYIGAGRMVHYMDVRDHAKNSTIELKALIMHKDRIPKEYHYVVLAWYDKVSKSGLNQSIMDTYETMFKTYLLNEGVSQEDVDTVVFRGYAGNVGPTTGQILYDNDVDIMLGWGSVDNICHTTGSIPEESILESVNYQITYNGEPLNRYIHRFGSSEGSLKLMEYLLSSDSVNYFNQ